MLFVDLIDDLVYLMLELLIELSVRIHIVLAVVLDRLLLLERLYLLQLFDWLHEFMQTC